MKTYGILLIGCGHIGQEHIQDIYFRKEFRIEAVVDRDIRLAEEFQSRYGAKHSGTDYRSFLDDPNVDIVIIATYADSHLSILRDCLAAGKHVLCEKPIARTMEDAEQFCRLVEQAQSKVLVAHILRHNLSYQTIARMIHSGAIGELRLMRMVQNHHAMNWPRYKRLMQDCPPIVDCGVHYLDVMQWFTGAKVTEISGIGIRTEEDLPEGKNNYEMVTVKLDDGSVGFYEAGWTKTISSNNMKEFVGPLGSIRLIFAKDRVSHQEEGDLIEYYRLEDKTYHMINVQGERKPTDVQFQCLIRMIEEGLPDRPTIDEVYSSFEAAIKAENLING